MLTFYDPKKPLGLVCDASPYGVRAVLFHVVNGEERPIAYASRTFSKAESGYAHIEKEALAVVFGIKRFHKYLYGRVHHLFRSPSPGGTAWANKANSANGSSTHAALDASASCISLQMGVQKGSPSMPK